MLLINVHCSFKWDLILGALLTYSLLQGASEVRQRFPQSKTAPTTRRNSKHEKHKIELPLTTSNFLYLLGLILIVFALVIVIEKQLPPGLKIKDQRKHRDRFIAERAYNHLKTLTNFGPRISGSYENEVLAVNFLKDEINNIISEAKEHNVIELDIQKVSGSFQLEFLDNMNLVYRDQQNVIVKVGSKIRSQHSLLINCHFDTVADSPGKFLLFPNNIKCTYMYFNIFY